MNFKTLGSSSVRIPEIGLGTWKYSGGVAPLRAGIDRGAAFIDTAEIYGTEETVGHAVAGCRQQVFLATKVAPRNYRRKDLVAAAEKSLTRLRTDYLDLYQLHWPNYVVPIEEPMAAMEELVTAGKVRFIGVSNFTVKEMRQAQKALTKSHIVSNQVSYSLLERTIENGLLQYCQQSSITVIAYSPLGRNFERITGADGGGFLARMSSAAGKSPAQLALNWLIAQDGVVAIPKASSADHAIEDADASGWRLAETDYQQLASEIPCDRRSPVALALRRWKRRLAQTLGRQL